MLPLENLHALKQDMEKNGWIVDSFRFNFKHIDYIVLVILFQPNEPRKQYALLQLDFLRADDFNTHFLTEANAAGLMADAKELRLFFGIRYKENLRDILLEFAEYLGGFIPKAVIPSKPTVERQAMVHTLSKKDSEDPNKSHETHKTAHRINNNLFIFFPSNHYPPRHCGWNKDTGRP